MKKFLYIVLALTMVSAVACNKKAKDEVRVYNETAAEKIASFPEFNVTWTCIFNETDTTTAEGTISFAKCEVDSIIKSTGEGYVARINAKCEALGVDAKAIVNVVHAGDDIVFSNATPEEDSFGAWEKITTGEHAGEYVWKSAAVRGRVANAYGEPSVTLNYKAEWKEGRKNNKKQYFVQ